MNTIKFDVQRLNLINIEEVVKRYGKLVKVGRNYMAICPWHDDHNPSLLVGGKMNRCKCMSCGRGGSVIDYVMGVKGVGFREACEMLGRDFGTLPCLPLKGGGAIRKEKQSRMTMKKVKQLIDFEVGKLKRKKEREHKEEFCYIPMEYLEEHIGGDNAFFRCLRSIFTEEGVEWAIREYKLGTWPHPNPPQRRGDAIRMDAPFWGRGAVMFPSIDVEGRVHNIKIQKYCDDMDSPQFFHKLDKSTYWLGAILAKRHPELFTDPLPTSPCMVRSSTQQSHPDGTPSLTGRTEVGPLNFDSTCFFGEHLLRQYPNHPVVLVESPKNAVIGACEVPMLVWIAVGNKGNLNRKRLECLRNRKVIVIPDNDAVDEWKRILGKMEDIATFCFSSFCEQTLGECGKKGDVADYLIKKLS